jgi:hypothetical protein
MLDESPNICWVCEKPVPEGTFRDPFGFYAHKDCLRLEQEKKPKTKAV